MYHKIVVLTLFVFFQLGLIGQHSFKITGGKVKMTQGFLVLNNTNLHNNASFEATNGTVKITGTTSVSIGGIGTTTLYNTTVNKPSFALKLGGNITVNNELNLTKGNLNLVDDTLTLGSANGIIINEQKTGADRIFASAGGVISKTLNLNAPNGTNPGNIGIALTSTKNLGQTTIVRGHNYQILNGCQSIHRYYTLIPEMNNDLNASIEFNYLDPEVNGVDETTMVIFEKSGTWEFLGASSRDANANKVSFTGLNSLHQYTIGNNSVGGTISGSSTVCSGTNISNLTLSGHTGAIQKWQYSTAADFSNPTDIENTTTSHTAENLIATTYFRAIIKNGGCNEVFSDTALIQVDDLSVGGAIAGSTTVCTGTNTSDLTLSGHTGAIQKWQYSTAADFSNPTDIENTITSHTAENLITTTYFRAIIKNGGCNEVFSDTALIQVDDLSVGGAIAGSTTVCTGTNTSDLTLSGHTGAIQKWQYSTAADFSNPTDIANTTTSHTAENLIATTYFRAIIKNGGCNEVFSDTALIQVDDLSVGGAIAGSTTVCTGTNTSDLTLSGHTGAVQKWQSSTAADFSNPTDIANTTTSLTAENLIATTYFRASIKNGGCNEVFSDTALIQVDDLSVGGAIAGSTTVCTGTNTSDLTLSGHTGAIQKWQYSTAADFSNPTDIANTTTSLTAENLIATTYFRASIKNGGCNEVFSDTAMIQVDDLSIGGTIAGSTTLCSGTNSSDLTLSGHTGTIQKWQYSTAADFSNPTDIANTTTSLTAENLIATTYFRASIKNGGCNEVFSDTALIMVEGCNQECQMVHLIIDGTAPENHIASDTFHAEQTITSKGVVPTFNNVVFNAGTSITLEAGFTIKAGATFIAKIKNCTPQQLMNPATERTIPLNNLAVAPNFPLDLKVFPNPFNTNAKIIFQIPDDIEMSMLLFDQSGRIVKQLLPKKFMPKGTYEVTLTDEHLFPGMFYILLQTPLNRLTRKVIIIKN